jgi:hypothetical protein
MAKNSDEISAEAQNAFAEINRLLESAKNATAQVVAASNEAQATVRRRF